MVKLLYITASLPFGPGETFFIPELHEFIRQGHTVTIAPRSPNGNLVNSDARSLLAYTVRQPLFALSTFGAAVTETWQHPLRVLRAVRLLLFDSRPRILLKNMAVFPKALWIARLCRKRGCDHIHAQWASTTATIAMIASEVTGIPWSFTAHRWDIPENNLLRIKIRRASFSRFISQDGLRMVSAFGFGTDRCCVIHMGVDVPAASAHETGEDLPLLLCPASLDPRKGHEYLLSAMMCLRARGVDFRLDIAGAGNLRVQLEQLVISYHLADRVRFLGQVPHDQLLGLYANGLVGAVVLPSLHEGIPVALMEAMAYGVPVVSTTTGGTPELLSGGAGLIVPPSNSEALANAIEQVIIDAALRTRLSHLGYQRINNEYDIRKVVGEILSHMITPTPATCSANVTIGKV